MVAKVLSGKQKNSKKKSPFDIFSHTDSPIWAFPGLLILEKGIVSFLYD